MGFKTAIAGLALAGIIGLGFGPPDREYYAEVKQEDASCEVVSNYNNGWVAPALGWYRFRGGEFPRAPLTVEEAGKLYDTITQRPSVEWVHYSQDWLGRTVATSGSTTQQRLHWTIKEGYGKARLGIDWQNCLQALEHQETLRLGEHQISEIQVRIDGTRDMLDKQDQMQADIDALNERLQGVETLLMQILQELAERRTQR